MSDLLMPDAAPVVSALREIGGGDCRALARAWARFGFGLARRDRRPEGRVFVELAALAGAVADDEDAVLRDALDPAGELTDAKVDPAGLVDALGEVGRPQRSAFAVAWAECRDRQVRAGEHRRAALYHALAVLSAEVATFEARTVAAWVAPEGQAGIIADDE